MNVNTYNHSMYHKNTVSMIHVIITVIPVLYVPTNSMMLYNSTIYIYTIIYQIYIIHIYIYLIIFIFIVTKILSTLYLYKSCMLYVQIICMMDRILRYRYMS